MGDHTYPASTAVQFVAIGRAQRRSNHAKNVYVEDRLLRAADAIAKRPPNNRHDPDFPDHITEGDVASAIETIDCDGDGLVGQLVRAGDGLIARAMENTRRSVRRRHATLRPMPPQEFAARDRRADDDWLDFQTFAERLPGLQRESVMRRVLGDDDDAIAAALKIQPKYVPVLVHRGVAAMKKMLTASDRANPDIP